MKFDSDGRFVKEWGATNSALGGIQGKITLFTQNQFSQLGNACANKIIPSGTILFPSTDY